MTASIGAASARSAADSIRPKADGCRSSAGAAARRMLRARRSWSGSPVSSARRSSTSAATEFAAGVALSISDRGRVTATSCSGPVS